MHSIWSGLLLLGVLVVVHEFGHFIVARWLGVRVEVFSVGFGPALFNFRRGHTQYRLSLIPLGGYVRMLGELPDRPVAEADKPESFSHKPVWVRASIALAGPLFNFVLPILLLFAAFWGARPIAQPVVGSVIPFGAAATAGLQPADRFLQINNKQMLAFADVVQQVRNSPNQPLEILLQRNNIHGQQQQLQLQVTPDVKQQQHPLHGVMSVGSLGILHAVAKPQVVVQPNSAAAAAGLQTNDVVLQINNQTVSHMQQLQQLLAQHRNHPITIKLQRHGKQQQADAASDNAQQSATVIEQILPAQQQRANRLVVDKFVQSYGVTQQQLQHPNIKQQLAKTQELLRQEADRLQQQRGLTFAGDHIAQVQESSPGYALGLRAGDRLVAVAGQPTPHPLLVDELLAKQPAGIVVLGVHSGQNAYVAAVRLVTKQPTDGSQPPQSPPHNKAALGHTYSWNSYSKGPMQTQYVGALAAAKQATVRTGEMMRDTLLGLSMLLTRQVPTSQLAGPIAIFNMAGQAAQQGLAYYLFMMALISINLGLLNLLPIPGLDGGQLLLFGIEALRGKPLPSKWQLWITLAGFAMLIAIMLMAIYNDISRFWS
ncbi:MAG: site-2 protease family protein [Myxococcota bacterium]